MQSEFKELQLFSKSQAAQYMHIGKEKLSDLIETGKIGVIDLNGSIKIPYIEIERFLKDSLVYNEKNTSRMLLPNKDIPEELLDEFDSTKIFERIKEGVN